MNLKMLTNHTNLMEKKNQIKVLNHFLINNKIDKNAITFFSLKTIRIILIMCMFLKLRHFLSTCIPNILFVF